MRTTELVLSLFLLLVGCNAPHDEVYYEQFYDAVEGYDHQANEEL